jgi:alpha-L-arabinofuranosidase
VRLKAEEWQEYQKRFPAILDKEIFLSIDEYAYSGARESQAGPRLRLGLQRDASVQRFP